MTRKEALTDLLEKVKAEKIDADCFDKAFKTGPNGTRQLAKAVDAFNGSLDAALALHEAVLPGCHFVASNEASGLGYVAEAFDTVSDGTIGHGHATTPARAWLIAILQALIAQEGDQ